MSALMTLLCLWGRATGFDDEITHPAITEQAVNDNVMQKDG